MTRDSPTLPLQFMLLSLLVTELLSVLICYLMGWTSKLALLLSLGTACCVFAIYSLVFIYMRLPIFQKSTSAPSRFYLHPGLIVGMIFVALSFFMSVRFYFVGLTLIAVSLMILIMGDTRARRATGNLDDSTRTLYRILPVANFVFLIPMVLDIHMNIFNVPLRWYLLSVTVYIVLLLLTIFFSSPKMKLGAA